MGSWTGKGSVPGGNKHLSGEWPALLKAVGAVRPSPVLGCLYFNWRRKGLLRGDDGNRLHLLAPWTLNDASY